MLSTEEPTQQLLHLASPEQTHHKQNSSHSFKPGSIITSNATSNGKAMAHNILRESALNSTGMQQESMILSHDDENEQSATPRSTLDPLQGSMNISSLGPKGETRYMQVDEGTDDSNQKNSAIKRMNLLDNQGNQIAPASQKFSEPMQEQHVLGMLQIDTISKEDELEISLNAAAHQQISHIQNQREGRNESNVADIIPDIQSTREDLWVWIYEEQAEQACLEHEEDSNELALNSRSTSRKQ